MLRSYDRKSLLSTPLTRRTPPTSTLSVTRTPDDRAIRDRELVNLMIPEVYEFLSLNKFELEMNHPLTSKTLRIPTQKDFTLMFQFLYNKIDPFHKFTRVLDVEVLNILKVLKYPHINSITRSQITAVGGNNWPHFLRILFWLVKLNLNIANVDDNETNGLEEELDALFLNYTLKTYEDFLRGDDDNEDQTELLKESLAKFFEKVDEEMIKRTEKTKELNKQLTAVSKEYEELQYAKRTTDALEGDLVKIQAYLDVVGETKLEWDGVFEKWNNELAKNNEKINELRQEKQQLNAKLSEKGINVPMIEKLYNEKVTILKNIDMFDGKIHDIDIIINEKTKDLNRIIGDIQQKIQEYNGYIYKMELNDYLPREKFQINLKFNYLDFTRNDLNEILNKDLKNDKIEFIKVKNLSQDSISELKDLIQKNSIEISKITQINDEKDRKLRSIEMINNSKVSEINDLEVEHEFKLNEYNKHIERAEYEITELKVKKEEEFIQDQNKLTAIGEEFSQVLDDVDKKRAIWMMRLNEITSIIENYQINVNNNLEDLESFITKEVEEL